MQQNRKKMQTWALTGNPNCGKTTLFNRITGSSETVGNFTGATVEQRVARLKSNSSVRVVDLPGTYSLIPYSPEEEVTRRFVTEQQPDLILNVADATNLERSLYLTTQLQEIGCPMVLALNMADELPRCGRQIDYSQLSHELNIPVFPVSAAKGLGISCMIQGCEKETQRPKLLQGNARLGNAPVSQAGVMHAAVHRYQKAEKICKASQRVRLGNNLRAVSDQIDRVLTGPAAVPLFFLLLFSVLSVAFGSLTSQLTGMLQQFVAQTLGQSAAQFLSDQGASEWAQSLVRDGIFAGLGGVLSFVPQLAVIFIFLEFISDCGYLARVAFVGDRILQKIGLSGRVLVPLLLGFGCTVPAVLATRALERPRDKILVLLMLLRQCTNSGLFVVSFLFFSAASPDYFVYAIFAGCLLCCSKRNTFAKNAAPWGGFAFCNGNAAISNAASPKPVAAGLATSERVFHQGRLRFVNSNRGNLGIAVFCGRFFSCGASGTKYTGRDWKSGSSDF